MNFDFNITANISQSNVSKPLEPNKIHEVTFEGCEAKNIEGKDSGIIFKVLEIKFKNKDGYFTHTIWEPREQDFEDRPGTFNNMPSNVKQMMLLLKHLIDTTNPELAKKIDNNEASLSTPSWDTLRSYIVENTKGFIGKTTKIKLVANKKGEAMFPYCASYDRNNNLYLSTNFIGDSIFFTTKEKERIEKAASAQATPIVKNQPTNTKESDIEDLDFDDDDDDDDDLAEL